MTDDGPEQRKGPWRVLLTMTLSPAAAQRLRDAPGIEPVQMLTPHDPTLADMEPYLRTGIDAILVCTNVIITSDVIALAAPRLRLVSTISAGFEHIDVAACAAAGVRVTNAPGVQNEAVADTAVALMFGAARRLKDASAAIASGVWPAPPPSPLQTNLSCGIDVYALCGYDVHSSTVGIVGLGGIGRALARRLVAFNCSILYTGRGPRPEAAAPYNAEFVALDELLRRADFVVVLCPLTEETRGMFDKSKFALMKRTAVFINVARGGLVNQPDLVDALDERRIFAAGLDVMTPEPIPPDHPLVKSPHCMLTPHYGSASFAARNSLCDFCVDNLVAAQAGKNLQSEVYLSRLSVV